MTRDELLTALLIERFGPDAATSRPTPTALETRGQLADDLPPDNRPGPTVIVRAARS